MITHRPCGECRALVDAEGGCPHWRPYFKTTSPTGKARRPHRATGLPRGGPRFDPGEGEP